MTINASDFNHLYAQALFFAQIHGDSQMEKALLSAHDDINKPIENSDYSTVLHLATERGYDHLVEILLRAGADPNARDGYLETALTLSGSYSRYGICQQFIMAGADVNACDMFGTTALMQAVRRQNHGLIKLLIENGANIDQKDKDGVDALMVAEHFGFTAIIQWLSSPTRDSSEATMQL